MASYPSSPFGRTFSRIRLDGRCRRRLCRGRAVRADDGTDPPTPMIIADGRPRTGECHGKIFMAMSEQERYETVRGLMEAVGDDPGKREEMETLMRMIPQTGDDDDDDGIRRLIQQDESREAKRDAARRIPDDWDACLGRTG